MITDPQSFYQLPEGTVLKDRYQIDSVLGRGGFGITYKGTDRMLQMTVAVKEFFPYGYAVRDPESTTSVLLSAGDEAFDKWRERFLAEARILAKCTDVPSIVQVRDFFEENNTAYIVMEYLSGISLRDHLQRNGVIPVEKIFSGMIPLIRDLDQVHRRGLIHRDISPDNIMLMPDDTLKLFDFGAARNYSDEQARTLSIMLKPGFAPEEQYRKKGVQGPWTDVYGICATMYKCITGVTPPDSLERLNGDDLTPPSLLGCRISPEMEGILLKGMSLRAENRFSDAASLADAMEACRQGAAPASASDRMTEIMEDKTEEQAAPGREQAEEQAAPGREQNDRKQPGLKQKRKWWIPVVIAAVAILILLLVLLSNPNVVPKNDAGPDALSGQTAETDKEDPEKNTGMFGGSYEPVSGDVLLDSALWGLHSFSGEEFPAGNDSFMDITTDQGSRNVSSLPVAYLINPAWNQEPLICLVFTDRFQYLYFVYGTYEAEGNILKISAPAYPQSVPALYPAEILDNAPVLRDSRYICEEGTSYPKEGTAYLLQDELSFFWDLESGACGHLRFKNGNNRIVYQSGYVNNAGSSSLVLHMQGSASDPERLYEDLEGLDLLFDPEREESVVTVYFADGSKSLDAGADHYYDPFGKIQINSTKTSRSYNGRTETFDDKHMLMFNSINTYPYGFIIHEYRGNENYYYYYQALPEYGGE